MKYGIGNIKRAPNAINSRKDETDEGIDELMASIKEYGLIHPLVVREHGDQGYVQVIDGHRRLQALKLLYRAKEHSGNVDVRVVKVDDTTATEMSLAANILTLPIGIIDQYEAFAEIEKRGKTISDIARSFGVREKQVRQALALGKAAPEARELYRKETLDMRDLQAFAKADMKRQLDVLKRFEKGELNNWALVNALDDDALAATSDIATAVGEEAYMAAGGTVTTDLFSEQDNTYWPDKEIAYRLYDEKKAKVIAKLTKEGWGKILSKEEYWGIGWCEKLDKKEWTDKSKLLAVYNNDLSIDRGYKEKETKAKKQEAPKEEAGMSQALLSDLDDHFTESAMIALSHDAHTSSQLILDQMIQVLDYGFDGRTTLSGSPNYFKTPIAEKHFEPILAKCKKISNEKSLIKRLGLIDKLDELELGMLSALYLKKVTPADKDLIAIVPQLNCLETFKVDEAFFKRLNVPQLKEIAAKEKINLDSDKKKDIIAALVKSIRVDWLPDYLTVR